MILKGEYKRERERDKREWGKKSQNLAELLLLRRCQRHGELDVVAHDKVAALPGLLGDGHAEARVCVGAAGLRRACLVEVEDLLVDGRHGALPACEGFFEVEIDRVDYVVAFAREEGVGFLFFYNVSIDYFGSGVK